MRTTVLARIAAYAPPSDDTWRELAALVEALGRPALEDVPILLGVFERFPRHDGHGVFWAILHAIERAPGYEPVLVEHVTRTPTELGVTMLQRLIAAGIDRVGATELAPLIAELAPRAPIVDYTIDHHAHDRSPLDDTHARDRDPHAPATLDPSAAPARAPLDDHAHDRAPPDDTHARDRDPRVPATLDPSAAPTRAPLDDHARDRATRDPLAAHGRAPRAALDAVEAGESEGRGRDPTAAEPASTVMLEPLLAALDAFAPPDAWGLDWAPLRDLVPRLLATADPAVVAPLLRVLDRFASYDAFPVYWPIVNGLEVLPGFARALVASLEVTPTRSGVTLLLRLLARGVTEIDGVDVAALAATLVNREARIHGA